MISIFEAALLSRLLSLIHLIGRATLMMIFMIFISVKLGPLITVLEDFLLFDLFIQLSILDLE